MSSSEVPTTTNPPSTTKVTRDNASENEQIKALLRTNTELTDQVVVLEEQTGVTGQSGQSTPPTYHQIISNSWKELTFVSALSFLIGFIVAFLVKASFCVSVGTYQLRNGSYNIADTQQCDKYYECTKAGKMLERVCDDGFVFSTKITACDYPHNVNCTERPELQPPQTNGYSVCPRLNGLYPFPTNISCQKFYHCLEGKAYEKTCPEGLIFDPSKGACIHPDLSHRKGCSAKDVLDFPCPNAGKKFARLRFGDHDRLPHPSNCRKFFICLADGKPRVGGCPLGKVFNPKLGMCDQPKRVPECKEYYGKRDPAKLAELGEEGSLLLEDEQDQEHGAAEQIESTADDEVAAHEITKTSKGPAKKKTFSKRQAPSVDAANSAIPPQQPQPDGSSPSSSATDTSPSQSQGQSPNANANSDDEDDGSKSDNDDADD